MRLSIRLTPAELARLESWESRASSEISDAVLRLISGTARKSPPPSATEAVDVELPDEMARRLLERLVRDLVRRGTAPEGGPTVVAKRTARQAQLLRYLGEHRRKKRGELTREDKRELARQMGVAERTLYRYLEALQAAAPVSLPPAGDRRRPARRARA